MMEQSEFEAIVEILEHLSFRIMLLEEFNSDANNTKKLIQNFKDNREKLIVGLSSNGRISPSQGEDMDSTSISPTKSVFRDLGIECSNNNSRY